VAAAAAGERGTGGTGGYTPPILRDVPSSCDLEILPSPYIPDVFRD